MESTSLAKNLKKTVEDLVKENGIWIFADTKCKANKKVCYTWTYLFQEFQDKESQVLLQEDIITKLRKEIYKKHHQVWATPGSY